MRYPFCQHRKNTSPFVNLDTHLVYCAILIRQIFNDMHYIYEGIFACMHISIFVIYSNLWHGVICEMAGTVKRDNIKGICLHEFDTVVVFI